MSAEEVTTDHLMSFMKKKMVKKDYGSVTIYLQEGKITKITEDFVYNPSSFISTAEKPINHLMVKNKNKKVTVIPMKKSDKETTSEENKDNLDIDEEI